MMLFMVENRTIEPSHSTSRLTSRPAARNVRKAGLSKHAKVPVLESYLINRTCHLRIRRPTASTGRHPIRCEHSNDTAHRQPQYCIWTTLLSRPSFVHANILCREFVSGWILISSTKICYRSQRQDWGPDAYCCHCRSSSSS